MPYPGLLHPVTLPLLQATADPYFRRRHSSTVLAQSLGPGMHKVCLSPLTISSHSSILAWRFDSRGFDSKSNFAPPTVFLGLLLCPWM